jgi:alpha-D-ribose 1-methylphosphonate 5-triphosphate diphosphatase PhnM
MLEKIRMRTVISLSFLKQKCMISDNLRNAVISGIDLKDDRSLDDKFKALEEYGATISHFEEMTEEQMEQAITGEQLSTLFKEKAKNSLTKLMDKATELGFTDAELITFFGQR